MHDPTQVDRQGPDRGTQYRSAIFTTSDEQDRIARKVQEEVQEEHYKGTKIATTIQKAGKWWDAEDYHQQCEFSLSTIFSLSLCSLDVDAMKFGVYDRPRQ